LSAVAPERVDDADTPPGDMSGIVLAPETTAGVTSPQRVSPKRTDDASTLAKDLLGVTLVPEMTVCSTPDTTSPPSIDQEVPSVFHPVPFQFSFDPPSDPRYGERFRKGISKPSGVPYLVNLGPTDSRLNLRAGGFRGRGRPRLRLGILWPR
jgi:hypothetical protein